MQQVALGGTGLRVSRLCIGCMSFGGPEVKGSEWTLGLEDSRKVIERAIDLGINFFDTADVYALGRSEEIVGAVLQGRRNDVVLATKVGLPTGEGPGDRGLGEAHVKANLRRSLEHLKTDRIDLYQIHRWDYSTPVEAVLRTLTDAVRKERTVDHIGGSSMWAWQFATALHAADRLGLQRFETMQNHYNLAYREEEREMMPLCRAEGVAVNPWSPLGRGFLTGKYRRGDKPSGARYRSDPLLGGRYFQPEDFDVVERLAEVASENGAKPAQLALAWLLSKPGVASPVIGPTSVAQLDELAGALDLKLTDDDARRLEEPYRPHRVLGHT